MPTCAEVPFEHGTLNIWAADLFLLEKWDPSSNQSNDDQRMAIFRQWMDNGIEERIPYLDRLRRISSNPSEEELSSDQRKLVSAVRHPDDQQDPGDSYILRTCYDEGTDETFDELIEDTEMISMVWNAASRSDFGRDKPDAWQQVLLNVPQLLEVDVDTARTFLDHRRQVLHDILSRGPIADLDESNRELAESEFHEASSLNQLFVVDREALESQEILLVWFDDRGKVVRWSRNDAYDTGQAEGLVMDSRIYEHHFWEAAQVGADYKDLQAWAEKLL